MGNLWEVNGTTGLVNFQKKGSSNLALEQGTSFPGSPTTGQVFYRTDLVQFYVYDGTNWRTQAGGSLRIYNETPSGTVGSGNTVFTVATAYISGSTVVTRDGLIMKPGGVDYTETPSTGTVTFITAPVSGSTILVSYSRTVGQDVQQLIRQDYVTGTPSGTYSGSTTVFDLPFTYTVGVGSLLVYSGGVLMLAGAGNDYVETDSDTITFNSARTVGEKIQFIKIGISADYGNSITLNSGTTNQVAQYSSSTNIVSTSAFIVGSNGPNGIIKGTTTNNSAAAGNVGEEIASIVVDAGKVTLPNNQYVDITTISLTAGDWDVSGMIYYTGTTATVCIGGISTSSGNAFAERTAGTADGSQAGHVAPPTLAYNATLTIPPLRVSLASTTSYYLKGFAAVTSGTVYAQGRLSARRVR